MAFAISYALMRQNYLRIVEKAKISGIFVWLDMEEPKWCTAVLKVYLDVGKHANGGICIQANLERSSADAKCIAKAGGVVRLVKGAYGR